MLGERVSCFAIPWSFKKWRSGIIGWNSDAVGSFDQKNRYRFSFWADRAYSKISWKIFKKSSKLTLLNISDYNNTILNNKTYLESNYKYFVNTSNGYEVVNALTGNDDEAALKLVIEIDKDASYEKGVGTIVDPIIISE